MHKGRIANTKENVKVRRHAALVRRQSERIQNVYFLKPVVGKNSFRPRGASMPMSAWTSTRPTLPPCAGLWLGQPNPGEDALIQGRCPVPGTPSTRPRWGGRCAGGPPPGHALRSRTPRLGAHFELLLGARPVPAAGRPPRAVGARPHGVAWHCQAVIFQVCSRMWLPRHAIL
jgi:hypothetical protein